MQETQVRSLDREDPLEKQIATHSIDRVAWQASVSVQLLSHVWFFVTPWTAACQASLSITSSLSLLKLMSVESVMPSNHLILCRPLLLPSILPSIRVFSNESVLPIMWPEYWSYSFSISTGLWGSQRVGTTEWLSTHFPGSIIGHLPTWGVAHLPVSYLFAFSHCPWGSLDKNTGVFCQSILQWTMFCHYSPLWPTCLFFLMFINTKTILHCGIAN